MHMLKTGEIRNIDDDEAFHEQQLQGESITQMADNQIIKRAPDKMIDYFENHILLAYRNTIMTINVEKYHTEVEEKGEFAEDKRHNVVDVKIPETDIDVLNLQD